MLFLEHDEATQPCWFLRFYKDCAQKLASIAVIVTTITSRGLGVGFRG